mmetsp:Transcript_10599/g.27195  ORF Transcript_10599/g.27195 Transcript_10599/m.27195 type:complete len:294 (+) Transcript_10599:37-918(+)
MYNSCLACSAGRVGTRTEGHHHPSISFAVPEGKVRLAPTRALQQLNVLLICDRILNCEVREHGTFIGMNNPVREARRKHELVLARRCRLLRDVAAAVLVALLSQPKLGRFRAAVAAAAAIEPLQLRSPAGGLRSDSLRDRLYERYYRERHHAHHTPRRLGNVHHPLDLACARANGRLREPAAEWEGRLAALHVPFHADSVHALGDRIDLQSEVGEQVCERKAAKYSATDECGVEAKCTHEGLLAAAHSRRTQEQILVDAIVRQEGGHTHRVPRIEGGVQPFDGHARAQHLTLR